MTEKKCTIFTDITGATCHILGLQLKRN